MSTKIAVIRSITLLTGIILFHKIPFASYLNHFGTFENSEELESLLIKLPLSLLLVAIIVKCELPVIWRPKFSKGIVFALLATVVYTFLFADLSQVAEALTMVNFASEEVQFQILTVFVLASFEEFVFRGVIFGFLFVAFHKEKYSIEKTVLLSSIFFGLSHILNLWTFDMPVLSVANQVYFAFCIGVLFSVIYVICESIWVVAILHFLLNFLQKLPFLVRPEEVTLPLSVAVEKSFMELVFGQIILVVIYSLPLFFAFLLLKIDHETFSSRMNETLHSGQLPPET